MQSSFVPTSGPSCQSLNTYNNISGLHVPRLAVRNKSRDELSPRYDANNDEDQTTSPSQAHSSSTRSVTNKSSSKTGDRHRRHESRESNGPERSSRGRHSSHKKSTGSGMLGFLTLKEPSTSALDQFAEQERKKAAQKGVKSAATVIPGVSMQKLPDHVPKVNSKWDGLPEGTKSRMMDYEDKDKANKRLSTTSIGSVSYPQPSSRTRRSTSSKSSARCSGEKSTKRASVAVAEVVEDWEHQVRLKQTFDGPTAARPALRTTQPATPCTYDPLAGHVSDTPLSTPPSESDNSEPPLLQERKYSSGTSTSPDASPRTPAFDSTFSPDEKAVQIRPLSAHDRLSRAFDINAPYSSNEEEIVVKSSGPDVLEPPLNMPSRRSYRPDSSTLPASYVRALPMQGQATNFTRTIPPALESGPALVRNFSHVSKYHQRSAASLNVTPLTNGLSNAASSNPSLNTSPQGRRAVPISSSGAGYTMNRTPVKQNEVLPWELVEPPAERSSTTYVARKAGDAGDASKLKRLSYKLGKK